MQPFVTAEPQDKTLNSSIHTPWDRTGNTNLTTMHERHSTLLHFPDLGFVRGFVCSFKAKRS
jgi:hypothetical protein